MKIIGKIISLSCLLLVLGCESLIDTANTSDNKQDRAQTSIETRVQTSVQLWSVKNDIKDDFGGTLQKIADMGFDGVEFAGNFGPYKNDPQGLKLFLEQLGLKVSGAHVGFKHFKGDKFQKTVDFYKVLGAKMLIIPMDKRAFNADKVDAFISDLVTLSEQLKPYGMQTGYHNHWQEFEPYNSTTFWDYIATSTPDDVILQMDIGWVEYAGQDPVEYVKRYPNRTLTSHYKAKPMKGKYENGELPFIGQDGIDWLAVINAQLAHGGTQWLVVEQEEYPNNLTPLEAVKVSKQALDVMLAEI